MSLPDEIGVIVTVAVAPAGTSAGPEPTAVAPLAYGPKVPLAVADPAGVGGALQASAVQPATRMTTDSTTARMSSPKTPIDSVREKCVENAAIAICGTSPPHLIERRRRL